MSLKVDVQGVAELRTALEQLTGKPLDRALRKATLTAARALRAPLQAAAPRDTGKLRKSIRARKARRGIGALVGPTVWYRHFVSLGTRRHRISAKDGALKVGSGFAQSVEHPGSKPNPYLSRVADAHEREVLNMFGDAVDDLIQ